MTLTHIKAGQLMQKDGEDSRFGLEGVLVPHGLVSARLVDIERLSPDAACSADYITRHLSPSINGSVPEVGPSTMAVPGWLWTAPGTSQELG